LSSQVAFFQPQLIGVDAIGDEEVVDGESEGKVVTFGGKGTIDGCDEGGRERIEEGDHDGVIVAPSDHSVDFLTVISVIRFRREPPLRNSITAVAHSIIRRTHK